MVNGAGFAPKILAVMPVWSVRLDLGIGVRGERWATMDRLLEANLVEQQILAALDAPRPDRLKRITCRTALLGGAKSPESISGRLLDELAAAIPSSTVALLPGLAHLAPQEHPGEIATAVLQCRER